MASALNVERADVCGMTEKLGRVNEMAVCGLLFRFKSFCKVKIAF